ncbi:laminin-binding protein Lsa27 [Leptospira kirschneri]|uniref:laminin-binding protein Lsa27 n=1 Tax=Leptospira kirschneri TaxID=29507 RepID=UPI00398B9F52
MKKLKYTFFLYLVAIGFVFSCGPKEEQFADGIQYLGGSNSKAEDQFKSIGLNARDVAKERLMKDLLELKEGIEEKRGHTLVFLSAPRISQSIQRAYNIPSKYDAMDAWVKSFEKGKAWCEYDLLFKDKIVSYEIEPMEATNRDIIDGVAAKDMRYRVYLRKEGQTGKLTLENSHVLVFAGLMNRKGEFGGFSIDTFVNHCPILSPEEEQYLKDFERDHPNGVK